MIAALMSAALLALAPAAPAFTIHARPIVEASGIARGSVSPGVFYVQNDSGDSARFFAVDAHTGALRETFHVPGAVNHDWEDLAVGNDARGHSGLWIADIGDNDANRPEVQVYRVPEPRVHGASADTARPEIWRLRYPSGPVNAESLFLDGRGRAYVVTKTTTGHSDVYALPPRPDAGHVQVLRKIGRIALHGSRSLLGGVEVQTTGAATSADGTVLVVRTYTSAYLWHVHNSDVAAALRAKPTVVGLPLQRQGEGICIVGDNMFLDSEGRDQPVWRVPLPKQFRVPVAHIEPRTNMATPAPAPSGSRAPAARPGSGAGGALAIAVFALLAIAVFATYRRRRQG